MATQNLSDLRKVLLYFKEITYYVGPKEPSYYQICEYLCKAVIGWGRPPPPVASFSQVLLTNELRIKLRFSDDLGTVMRGVNLVG